MPKVRFFSILSLVTLLLFASMLRPTQRAKAGFYIEYYTVIYNCIIGPELVDSVVGEWTRDCSGQMTGWGWEPGHNCTYTDTSYGDECIQ